MYLALLIIYLNLSLLSLSPIQQLLYEGAWWFHDFEPKKEKFVQWFRWKQFYFGPIYSNCYWVCFFFPSFIVCKINMILSNFYFGWFAISGKALPYQSPNIQQINSGRPLLSPYPTFILVCIMILVFLWLIDRVT